MFVRLDEQKAGSAEVNAKCCNPAGYSRGAWQHRGLVIFNCELVSLLLHYLYAIDGV